MSKLDVVLREEIRRIARREFKTLSASLLASNKRLRDEVRSLRSEIAGHKTEAKRLAQTERIRAAMNAESDQATRRWSGQRMRAWREKNSLSGVKIAGMLGVSSQTLYNWEMGRSKPDDTALAAIAGLRSLGKRELFQAMEEVPS